MPEEPRHPRDVKTRVSEDAAATLDTTGRGPSLANQLPEVPREHYHVEGEFARGGMGRILKARDQRLWRPVALKELYETSGADQRRFVREALVTARLQHPSIVPVYEAGCWPGGPPFYAMKMVSGRSLDALLRETPTLQGRLALLPHVLAVAEAIAYAHSQGIIHRDLKPANVLVGPFGETVVVDWGLAKDLREGSPEPEALEPPDPVAGGERTVVGTIMGTPHYMPPEQARGQPVDERADVYALGAILYYVLCGTPPHRGKTVEEVLAAVLSEGPEPVESREPEAPQDLFAIVRKAMARDPVDRYPTARELAADLKRYATGQLVSVHHYSTSELVRRFLKRHRAAVLVAAVLTLGLALSLVAGILGVRREARVAADERDKARRETAKAEQINAFVQRMLGSADPRAGGRDVTVAQALDAAARRVEAELEGEPEVQAAVRTTIGTTYHGLGLLEPAKAQLQAALDIRRRVLGPGHRDVARSLSNLASVTRDAGDLRGAEQLFRDAVAGFDQAGPSGTIDGVHAKGELAGVLQDLGRLDEAEPLLRETLEQERTLQGRRSDAVAASLNNLAVLLGQQGTWSEAASLHREALDIVRETKGPEHPDVAGALSTLASALDAQGNFAEAEALFREAMAMRTKLQGPEHPDVAWTAYNYAFTLRRKGDLEGAVRLTQMVLAHRGKTIPDSHPMLAAALQVQALCLVDLGKPAEAEPLLRESLELRRRTLPAGHWLLASSESALGACLLARGRYAAAAPLLVHGYEGLRDALGDGHERTVEAKKRLEALDAAGGPPRPASRPR